ncbi:hypothetical protein KNE206_34310 [Kitasatospora sp. NE20-6]
MDEFEPSVGRGGEDALAAELPHGLLGLFGALGGDGGGQALPDVGAEQGGGPGEPQGGRAELVQPVLEGLAAGGGGEVVQAAGVLLARFEALVADLAQQRHDLVRGAAGDGPDLAAEGVLGVAAEFGADEVGDGVGGEAAQFVAVLRDGLDLVPQAVRGVVELVAVGEDEQHGQFAGADGEGGEPVERLHVGPVEVVDDHDERGAARGELGEDEVEAVADALGVEGFEFVGGRDEADGGADDAVPAAEDLLLLVLGERAEDRLEELAQDAEGFVALAFAAAGEEHGALGLELGHAAHAVQDRGLAHAAVAGVEEDLADLGAAGGELAAEAGHGLLGGVHLRVALAQRLLGRRSALFPPALSVLVCRHRRALRLFRSVVRSRP